MHKHARNLLCETKLNKVQEESLLKSTDLEEGWYKALQGELGMNDLDLRREMVLLKYYFKTMNMKDTRIPKRILLREWPKRLNNHSMLSTMKGIMKRWKIGIEPDQVEKKMMEEDPEGIPPKPRSVKEEWTRIIKEKMDEYNRKRNSNSKKNNSKKNIIGEEIRIDDSITKITAVASAIEW